MRKLDKPYINRLLDEERLWKPGEADTFISEFDGCTWEVNLKRLPYADAPDAFRVCAARTGTATRVMLRYPSMSAALLGICNGFTPLAGGRDIYKSINDVLKSDKL